MTADQAIGYTLLNTSALTTITSTRVYHGMRPDSTTTPCVNFFRMPGGSRKDGMDRRVYSINCRAVTANTAIDMAKIVIDTFHGTSGRGVKGDVASSFSVISASLQQDGGLIFEDADNLYNAPVDIQVVYPTSTVT